MVLVVRRLFVRGIRLRLRVGGGLFGLLWVGLCIVVVFG